MGIKCAGWLGDGAGILELDVSDADVARIEDVG